MFGESDAGGDDNDVDITAIKSPIELGLSGFSQIIRCLQSGTPEICHMLMEECDVILECKVCRSLFRGIPNFLGHKQVFCKQQYQQSNRNAYQDRHSEVVFSVDTRSKDGKAEGVSPPSKKDEVATATAVTSEGQDQPCSQTPSPNKLIMSPLELKKIMRESRALCQSYRGSKDHPEDIKQAVVELKRIDGISCAVQQDVKVVDKTTKTVTISSNQTGGESSNMAASTTSEKNRSSTQAVPTHLPDYRKLFASNSNCDLKKLKCIPCNKSYDTFKGLKFHMISMHMQKKRFWKCPQCGGQLQKFYNLTKHMQEVHKIKKSKIENMREELRTKSAVSRVIAEWNKEYGGAVGSPGTEKAVLRKNDNEHPLETKLGAAPGVVNSKDSKSPSDSQYQSEKCWQCLYCKHQFIWFTSMIKHLRKLHKFKQERIEKIRNMLKQKCYIGKATHMAQGISGHSSHSGIAPVDPPNTRSSTCSKDTKDPDVKITHMENVNSDDKKKCEKVERSATAKENSQNKASVSVRHWKCVFCKDTPRYYKEFGLVLKHARKAHKLTKLRGRDETLKSRCYMKVPVVVKAGSSAHSKGSTDRNPTEASKKSEGAKSSEAGEKPITVKFKSGFSLHCCPHCHRFFGKASSLNDHIKNSCSKKPKAMQPEQQKPDEDTVLLIDDDEDETRGSSESQASFTDSQGTKDSTKSEPGNAAEEDEKHPLRSALLKKQWKCIFCIEAHYYSDFGGIIKHAESFHKIRRSQLRKTDEVWKKKAFMKVPVLCEPGSSVPLSSCKSEGEQSEKPSDQDSSKDNSSTSSKTETPLHQCPLCYKAFTKGHLLSAHLYSCELSCEEVNIKCETLVDDPGCKQEQENCEDEKSSEGQGADVQGSASMALADTERCMPELKMEMDENIKEEDEDDEDGGSVCVEQPAYESVDGTSQKSAYNLRRLSADILTKEDQERKIAACINEKELMCLKCGQTFKDLSGLRTHAVRHLGWRRYRCKLCAFTSYYRSEARRHLRRIHPAKTVGITNIDVYITELDVDQQELLWNRMPRVEMKALGYSGNECSQDQSKTANGSKSQEKIKAEDDIQEEAENGSQKVNMVKRKISKKKMFEEYIAKRRREALESEESDASSSNSDEEVDRIENPEKKSKLQLEESTAQDENTVQTTSVPEAKTPSDPVTKLQTAVSTASNSSGVGQESSKPNTIRNVVVKPSQLPGASPAKSATPGVPRAPHRPIILQNSAKASAGGDGKLAVSTQSPMVRGYLVRGTPSSAVPVNLTAALSTSTIQRPIFVLPPGASRPQQAVVQKASMLQHVQARPIFPKPVGSIGGSIPPSIRPVRVLSPQQTASAILKSSGAHKMHHVKIKNDSGNPQDMVILIMNESSSGAVTPVQNAPATVSTSGQGQTVMVQSAQVVSTTLTETSVSSTTFGPHTDLPLVSQSSLAHQAVLSTQTGLVTQAGSAPQTVAPSSPVNYKTVTAPTTSTAITTAAEYPDVKRGDRALSDMPGITDKVSEPAMPLLEHVQARPGSDTVPEPDKGTDMELDLYPSINPDPTVCDANATSAPSGENTSVIDPMLFINKDSQ